MADENITKGIWSRCEICDRLGQFESDLCPKCASAVKEALREFEYTDNEEANGEGRGEHGLATVPSDVQPDGYEQNSDIWTELGGRHSPRHRRELELVVDDSEVDDN